jgi:hypothetical protein
MNANRSRRKSSEANDRPMRTRVTSKAWFGPRKYFGWGWRPVSWEGWLAAATFAALFVVGIVAWPHSRPIVVVAGVALYGVVVVLSGDRPGGPRRRNDPTTDIDSR